MACPYSALGLQRGASAQEIKQAYKKLVLQHHPDRHVSAGEAEAARALAKFKAVKEAYEVLSDERKRSAYEAGRGAGSSSSSSYSYRGATYGSYANTDWAKSYYQHRPGGQGYTSRLSPWQVFRRRVYAAVMANNASLHLGLAGILLGGVFVGDLIHKTIWEFKNAGKLFTHVQQPAARPAGARSMHSSSSNSNSSSSAGSSAGGTSTSSSSSSPGPGAGSSAVNSSDASSSSTSSSAAAEPVAGVRMQQQWEAAATGQQQSEAPPASVQPDAGGPSGPRQLRPGPWANMRGVPVTLTPEEDQQRP